eukprot:EG_transcript_3157
MPAFTMKGFALLCTMLLGGNCFSSVDPPPTELHPRNSVFNNRFIIKWKSNGRATDSDAFSEHVRTASSRSRVQMLSLRHNAHSRQSVVQLVRYTSRTKYSTRAAFLRAVAADPAVEYIVEDSFMYLSVIPSDPYYGAQWHYSGVVAGGVYPSGFTYGLNLPDAWARTTGSSITVAVVDSGITRHPDLNAKVLPGYDMVSPDSPGVFTTANDGDGRDPDPSDPGDWTSTTNSSWHGTHVAGTIAAMTNNSFGVAGVAWGARILPVRTSGAGSAFTSDVLDSIRWAAGLPVNGVPINPNTARVINLSLGGTRRCTLADQEAIDAAIATGAILVAAAGNGNQDASSRSPCNCRQVICVAAHGPSGQRAVYSNAGAAVDITAPGGDTTLGNVSYGVLSTFNNGTEGPDFPAYAFLQGTSMATPHVSGLVALMLSLNANLTWEPVESILKLTARPFPGPNVAPRGCNTAVCGAGLVDAAQALAFVASMPANDRCEAAIPISCGQTVWGSVQYATALSADPQCGGTLQTGADVWYSIKLNGTFAVGLSTNTTGTDFDTQINLYNASCSSLMCLAGNNNVTATNPSSALTSALSSGIWLIRVSGAAQARGSFALAVTCVVIPSSDPVGTNQQSNNGWWIGLAAGLGAGAGVAAAVAAFIVWKVWGAAHSPAAANSVKTPNPQTAPQAGPFGTPTTSSL